MSAAVLYQIYKLEQKASGCCKCLKKRTILSVYLRSNFQNKLNVV